MPSSTSSTVSIQFVGDPAALFAAFEDMAKQAVTTGDDIEKTFSDLSDSLNPILEKAGTTGADTGSAAIAGKYDDVTKNITDKFDALNDDVNKILDTAGEGGAETGATAIAGKYDDVTSAITDKFDALNKDVNTLLDTAGTGGAETGATAIAAKYDDVVKGITDKFGDLDAKLNPLLDAAGTEGAETGSTAIAGKYDDVVKTITESIGGLDAKLNPILDTAGVAGADTGAADITARYAKVAEDIEASMAAASAKMDASLATGGAAGAGAAGVGGAEGGEGESGKGAAEEGEGAAKAEGAEAGEGVEGGLLATLMDPEVLAPLVAAVGAIWATVNLQDYEHKIAAAENISIKAAQAIATSWGSTAGQSIYSENQMAEAYSEVAGQFSSLEGMAANTTEAHKLMAAAADLAEASSTDLDTAMQGLVSVMQAFGIKADGAEKAATALYVVSEKSGQPISTIVTQFQKLHSQLGDVTPPLGQLGGLFLDLLNNGESGRAGLAAVQTAVSALLKPSSDLGVAQSNLQKAFDATTGPSRTLASEYQHRHITSEQYKTAVEGLNGQQSTLATNFQTAYDKITSANLALKEQGIQVTNAHGKFVGLASIIEQLSGKMHGETQAQQLATAQAAFGASANRKLIDVILAGPAAFEKYTKQVGDVKDMQQAATKNTDTLGGKFHILEAAAIDLADKLGPVLIPVVQGVLDVAIKLLDGVSKLVEYFEGHKAEAIAFGAALVIAFAPITGIPLLIAGVVTAGKLLIDHWKTVETFFTNLGKSVWSALDTEWHKVENDATTTWDAINHFFSGIPDKIVGFFAKFSLPGLLVTHWSAIKSAAEAAWGAIEHVVEVVPQKMWDFFKTLPLVGELATHWKTILTDAVGGWEAVNRFIMGIPGDIVRFFQKWTLVELINKAWSDIDSGAHSAWAKTLSFVKGIPGDILHVFAHFGTLLVEIGESLIDGLLSGITKGVTHLLGNIPSIGGKILGGIGKVFGFGSPATEVIPIGQSILEGLEVGMKDSGRTSSILSLLTSLANQMLTTLKSYVPQFQTVGEQMMQGLAQGIEISAAAVATATANAATAALQAAKVATKTSSPSLAFMELGGDWMAGAVNGVNATKHLVAAAVASAATGASAAFSGGMSGGAGRGGAGAGQVVINGPLVQVVSPNGTLPPQILSQVDAQVQKGLTEAFTSLGAATGGL